MSYSNFSPKNKFEKIMAVGYTAWVFIWFVVIFLALFPLFFIFLQKEAWKPLAHKLNRIWGKILFPIIGMSVQIRKDFIPEKNKTYVFVANHFSYWDIACMGLVIDNYFAFVGKSSVKKIPLLGYMFKKLHIQVDRSQKESRARSLTRAMRALKNGRSMVIFAEGGIVTKLPPQMIQPFKEGAFSMAIQNQIPIVPISLLNNYKIIWHDDLLLRRQPVQAVIHKPIETLGMKASDIDSLKQKTWNIIQNELNTFIQTQSNKNI